MYVEVVFWVNSTITAHAHKVNPISVCLTEHVFQACRISHLKIFKI